MNENDILDLAREDKGLREEIMIDPYFVKQMKKREERRNEMNRMKPMCVTPGRSGWIILLQNRVLLDSVGNIRYKRRVWFDIHTHKIGDVKENCTTLWREATLKNGQRAAGWMEE